MKKLLKKNPVKPMNWKNKFIGKPKVQIDPLTIVDLLTDGVAKKTLTKNG